MKLSTLVTAGAAAVAGYLVAPSTVTATTTPPTTIDCASIPRDAPPLKGCFFPPTTTSSTPGAPPPVETTNVPSVATPPATEGTLPQDQPDAISNPHVSGYTIPAVQLIPPVSITAPTKGCGA